MNKNKIVMLIIAVVVSVFALSSCSNQTSNSDKPTTTEIASDTSELEKTQVVSEAETQSESQTEENTTIEEQEESTQAESVDAKKIVNLSPPLFSVLCLLDAQEQVVGTNPRTFNSANADVLNLVAPNYKNINSDFVGSDFKVNKESLLQLEPELILTYGKFAEDLKELDIPIENLMIKSFDPKETTLYWESKLSEILGIDNPEKIKKAWDNTDGILERVDEDKKLKGLYIFANTQKGLFVSGHKSYGNFFMEMLGIENVAKKVGQEQQNALSVEVSMEQINAWNPDVIFVGMGTPAQKILNAEIPNQNWENISAVNEKMVFTIPQGIYSWFALCSDSPLMPLWMMKSVYSDKLSEEEFKAIVIDFYQDAYGVELNDELYNGLFQ